MNYKQAYKGITAIKKNQKDPLDTFFLPLVIDLGYQLSFDNGDTAGKTIISHDTKTITANLTTDTQLIFYGNQNPEIKFEANKIYIYMDEDYSLIVQMPRFSSMYHKFTIEFDKTNPDINKFDQLIALITYRKDAKTDEKSMRSLQLDTDLSAFQNDDHELLQTVMHVINQALSTDDIGLIQFIIKKINSDYHTQYTNREIMNVLKADFKRRQTFQHQYMLVDVFEMAKKDEKRQQELQAQIEKQKNEISAAQIKSASQSTEKLEEKPQSKAIDPKDKFKALFYGDDSQEDASSSVSKSESASSENTSQENVKENDANQESTNLNNTKENNVNQENAKENSINQNDIQQKYVQENNFSSDDFKSEDDQNNVHQENSQQEDTNVDNDYSKLFRQNNDEQNAHDLADSEQKNTDLNNTKQNKKEDDNDGGFDYSKFF